MSLTMTIDERQAFLADVHVGILSVAHAGRGPLSVPVWYTYEPGGTVDIITGAATRKAELITAAGRFSLCVQTEVPPYRYVSVEGAVARTDSPVDPAERQASAYRYLGREFGDQYLEATAESDEANVVIRMRPETWLSADFAKEFG